MPHTYSRILVHLIWTTKNRERVLTTSARSKLERHLLDLAPKNEITLIALNVQPEHVHALVNLAPSQRLEDVVKQFKGESAHWINAGNILKEKFAWQKGYGAFAVSPSHADAVTKYIAGQDEHHRRKSFAEEFKTILAKYGFKNLDLKE